MGNEVTGGVGRTAVGVAMMRALESRRPDRLFDDPYAQAFVDAAPDAFPPLPPADAEGLAAVGAEFASHAVLRTRFFDDYLRAACADGGCRQVVLLAAGLDTRAFRLDWPPGVHLFEVDLPEVLRFKEQVLAGVTPPPVPRCQRSLLAADLRADWTARLRSVGFAATCPTAWLVEGLLIYLSADEAARLLTGIGELSAPSSRVAFEYGDPASSAVLQRACGVPTLDEVTKLWQGGLGRAAPDWLAQRGWHTRIDDLAALGDAYGRPVPNREDGFVTAVRGPLSHLS